MIKDFEWQGTHRFELENRSIRLVLLSYGARMNELIYNGKDVVIGYDSLEDMKQSEFYTNPIVGRFANRIAKGRFTLNGVTYQLEKNERGVTHLHGGSQGFDKVEWDWEILENDSVRFFRTSPHMEMGYPGNLDVSVTYTLLDCGVKISYRAKCDRDTVLNLTNHSYFNMDGYDGGDCREMELTLAAPYYLPVDGDLIPTGDPAGVEGTEFDFRSPRPIKGEYDHCFVFDGYGELRPVCKLYSPASRLGLTISTDLPGMQLYTGTYLDDAAGKGGVPIHKHQAVALETQFLPDSPNHPNYPSTVLKAGDVFESVSTYEFWKQ